MKFLKRGTLVSACPSGKTSVLIAVRNAWKVIIMALAMVMADSARSWEFYLPSALVS